MSLHRRGKEGIFHAVIGVNGKAVWRSTHTADKEEAKDEERRLYKLLNGIQQPKKGFTSIPWKEFIDRYEDEYCRVEKKAGTYYRDKFRIRKYKTVCNINESGDLTPQSLNLFKQTRSGTVTNRTINRDLGVLKNLAWWGQKEKCIGKEHDFTQVTKLGEVKKRRQFYEENEILKLKASIYRQPLKRQLIGLGGLLTGLRTTELINLKVKYFDFENDIVRLDSLPGWTPKDNEERTIPLYEEYSKVVKAWIRQYRLKPEEFLYQHADGAGRGDMRWKKHRMNRSFFNEVWHEILKEAKIKKGSFYSGKHTFATHMADKVPLHVLQSILGHSNPATTKIYVHMKEDLVKKAAKNPPF